MTIQRPGRPGFVPNLWDFGHLPRRGQSKSAQSKRVSSSAALGHIYQEWRPERALERATARRAAKEKVILAVQDTTDLNYSAHPKNAERLEGCLAIDMVVAWRIVRLTKLGREVPDVPCTVFFEEAQWKALVALVTEDWRVPAQPPTLREAVRMMAMRLGGFLGRKCDGEPGTEVIWKALERLDDMAAMWTVMAKGVSWQSPTERELNTSGVSPPAPFDKPANH